LPFEVLRQPQFLSSAPSRSSGSRVSFFLSPEAWLGVHPVSLGFRKDVSPSPFLVASTEPVLSPSAPPCPRLPPFLQSRLARSRCVVISFKPFRRPPFCHGAPPPPKYEGSSLVPPVYLSRLIRALGSPFQQDHLRGLSSFPHLVSLIVCFPQCCRNDHFHPDKVTVRLSPLR